MSLKNRKAEYDRLIREKKEVPQVLKDEFESIDGGPDHEPALDEEPKPSTGNEGEEEKKKEE